MLSRFKAYQLSVQLYKRCETIRAPGHLKDQLLRASLSVVLNLAEGNGKPTFKDKRRFFGIALGSLRETQALLDLRGSDSDRELADQIGACLYTLVHRSGLQ